MGPARGSRSRRRAGALLLAVVDGLTGGARDRARDASLEWALRADIYGNLRWGVGGGGGLITTGYVAADW